MKKAFSMAIVVLGLTSCTLTTYLEKDLAMNYELKMTSKNERALFEKVTVFVSEKDIKGEFTVVSLNTYSPIVLPVIGNRKKVVTAALYKKAVKAADDQKGNAILIMDEAHFKVLRVK